MAKLGHLCQISKINFSNILTFFSEKTCLCNAFTYRSIPTKKETSPCEKVSFPLYIKQNQIYASATTCLIETYERSALPLWKVTTPSTKAYNVWSLPIPTFSPG